jgi:hypothetical protein
MNQAVADSLDSVTAELTYTVDTGEKQVNESYGPGNIYQRSNGTYEPHQVAIRDGRPLAGRLSLDGNGFIFVKRQSAVRDFFDKEHVKAAYYPELERLVCEVSGASRALVFDHTVRSGDEGEREQKLVREPVLYVHNDYTDASGPRRVRELLPLLAPDMDVEQALQKRFAIIQVWRPIRPVLESPLAIADSTTLDMKDLIPVERRYPDRVGETYRLQYNPAHRWFYFPHMQPDEAIVFKVFETEKDGRARFTPHSAFKDPTSPPGAPHRRSIEARLFAFFS